MERKRAPKVPEGLILGRDQLYLHGETLRKKIDHLGKTMLDSYKEQSLERFQEQLDQGMDIDIRLSKKMLGKTLHDFRKMLKNIDDFIKVTIEQTLEAYETQTDVSQCVNQDGRIANDAKTQESEK